MSARPVDFWKNVDTSGGDDSCWNWLGAKDKNGRGVYSFDNKKLHVGRATWFQANGDPGRGNMVLTTCKNNLCCNIKHLYLGRSPRKKMTPEECYARNLDAGRRYENRLMDLGICKSCKGPNDRPRQRRCSGCLSNAIEKLKSKRDQRYIDGLCPDCGRTRDLEKSTSCSTCKLKRLASRYLGSPKRWPELAALLSSQDNKCAYTGRHIILGDDATIDHIIPQSRGGPNDIANLHWVTWIVNVAKLNLLHDEFLDMCSDVHARRGTVT